jgi:coenzyme F420 hydrogenase subunit beta
MNNKKNIQYISENILCTACGGCKGVCPVDAIKMNTNIAGYIFANVDSERCIECGKCLKVCPSVKGNLLHDNNKDIFYGEIESTYVGYATDKKVRQVSQSGGVVTALLSYLVDSNEIDGAIVNRFNTSSSRPKVFFESDISKIHDSAGSYYTQSSVVEEILKHQDKKTAAVLLGCQSESVKLIRETFPNVVLPEYLIGLICAGQHSGNYIDELTSRAGGFPKGISKFRFRDKQAGGWPGHTKIESVNGKSKILNKDIRQSLKPAFEVHRCLYCFDQMNIYSDITVGDPWGIHEKLDRKGYSVIIARTNKGKELIEKAIKEGVINAEKISSERVLQGQTVDSRLKTQFFTTIMMAESNGYETPYNMDFFRNIDYKKPTQDQEKILKKRFEYSRNIYESSDLLEYKKKLNRLLKRLYIKRITNKLQAFPKRLMRYVYR